jgi:hypothetical protein
MEIFKNHQVGCLTFNYTLRRQTLDVWEGINNPFTRPRCLEIEEIDISPDEDSIFADAGEYVRIFEAESERDYAQAKASWKDNTWPNQIAVRTFVC